MRRPVAVDHEPRVALHDQMRVEILRHPLGDAGDADVPADVPLQLALRQAEIAERLRNQAAVMIAGEQERRASQIIVFADRGNIFGSEE